jgi:putative ABC transport system permease protein
MARNCITFARRQGMMLAIAGITIGLVSSLLLARVLAGFLFGVAPRDPTVFTMVTFLLAGVAFIAVWLPARRATQLDPVTALRQE